MVLWGGLGAGTLFGINLFLTSRYFDMNHNDAFSSMRKDSFRHFLRLRIKGEHLTIFAIGIDSVPQRSEWRENKQRVKPTSPRIIPIEGLAPKLIEPPIHVDAGGVRTVREVASGKSLEPNLPLPSATKI
jgi:hypothetical protein